MSPRFESRETVLKAINFSIMARAAALGTATDSGRTASDGTDFGPAEPRGWGAAFMKDLLEARGCCAGDKPLLYIIAPG